MPGGVTPTGGGAEPPPPPEPEPPDSPPPPPQPARTKTLNTSELNCSRRDARIVENQSNKERVVYLHKVTFAHKLHLFFTVTNGRVGRPLYACSDVSAASARCRFHCSMKALPTEAVTIRPIASHCVPVKCSSSKPSASSAATAGSMLIMMPKT